MLESYFCGVSDLWWLPVHSQSLLIHSIIQIVRVLHSNTSFQNYILTSGQFYPWETAQRLNQIVYTTSDGQARVLFDEKLSHRGAKLCIAKKKRAQDLTEMNVNLNVVVPFQPKNFRDVNKAVSARDTHTFHYFEILDFDWISDILCIHV